VILAGYDPAAAGLVEGKPALCVCQGASCRAPIVDAGQSKER